MSIQTNEILALRGQLATAQEDIKQYKDTIISQANELAVLRNNLCTRCKSNTAVGASLHFNSPSESETATRNVRRRHNSPTLGASSRLSQPHSFTESLLPLTSSKSTSSLPYSKPYAATSSSAQRIPIQSALSQLFVSQITSKPPRPPQALATISSDNPTQPTFEKKFLALPIVPDAKRALPNVTFVGTFEPKITVSSVRFSPNGKYLAVGVASGIYGDEQGKVLIYNLETRLKAYVLAEHSVKEKSGVRSMSFSPDGKHLAIGYYQAHISVWNVAKERVRNRFRGHGRLITSLDFSPNARLVVSASLDRTVRIWGMRDGSSRILASNALSFRSVRFSPDGQYVAAGNEDHEFRIWSIRTGQLMLRWTGHQNAVCVTFSPDGKRLVTGGYDIKYWNSSPLIPARPGLGTTDVADNEEVLAFVGHTERVTSVACSPDGKWILSGSIDHSICIWDGGDASPQCKLEGHQDSIWSVDFSPIGGYFAAGGWEGEVSLWKCIK